MMDVHMGPATRQTGAAAALLAAAFVLLAGGTSPACSIPVFRYALDNWPPDYYAVKVLSREPLAEATRDMVDRQLRDETRGPVNADVRVEVTPEAPETPTFEVRYPFQPEEIAPIHAGELSAEALAAVFDSPARAEIAKRLIGGESAVWIFLESGDAAADKGAFDILDAQLSELEKILELPAIDPADFGLLRGAEEDTAPELSVSFSILKIRRGDPEEAFFVRMLLGTEADLDEFREPMAFPVFGRGRALFALVGKGINPGIIAEASAFLTGACSCQVKAQNPGVDLLIRADWDRALEGVVYEEVELPPLTGIMPLVEEAESAQHAQLTRNTGSGRDETAKAYALESAVASAQSMQGPPAEEGVPLTRILTLAGIGVAVLAGGSALALLGFGRKD